jgi:DNA-directed RNA polymerase subunit K/omega
MPIRPIDLELFSQNAKNVHEAIVSASKRARQISEEQKIEFNQRISLFTTKSDPETEESDVNPDQLKVSLEFEKRPKPTDVALNELLSGMLTWRYKEKEEVPVEKEEEEEQQED